MVRGDAGQAFPLYITAVAALLFLALALFAVGRAGATKNGAQTAADAAALAAAQDYRDQLRTGFLTAVGAGGDAWTAWLAGRGAQDDRACAAAASYAGRNDAAPGVACGPGDEPGSFTVTVTSRRTVGESVVPGTESRHATATAKAVVEPRCAPRPGPMPGPTSSPTASPGPTSSPSAGPSATPGPVLLCDGKVLVIRPGGVGGADAAVKATDLFTVHLAD